MCQGCRPWKERPWCRPGIREGSDSLSAKRLIMGSTVQGTAGSVFLFRRPGKDLNILGWEKRMMPGTCSEPLVWDMVTIMADHRYSYPTVQGAPDRPSASAIPVNQGFVKEELSGVVDRVTYHNPDNGWSVLQVLPFDSPGRREPCWCIRPGCLPGPPCTLKGRGRCIPNMDVSFPLPWQKNENPLPPVPWKIYRVRSHQRGGAQNCEKNCQAFQRPDPGGV